MCADGLGRIQDELLVAVEQKEVQLQDGGGGAKVPGMKQA